MYNIHSHYENLFSYVKALISQPRLVYLHPFGTTEIENLESINIGGYGPIFFCYDQEPIIPNFNRNLFSHVRQYKDDSGYPRSTIVLNTEKNSQTKNNFLDEFGFEDCYYFFHAFAAADWYRGYQYCTDLTPIDQRKLKKKYISFNRITGGARMYRSILIAELAKNDLLKFGNVSYSHICPEYGEVDNFLQEENYIYQFNPGYLDEIKYVLKNLDVPLRIDNVDLPYIPNNSQTLSAIPECMQSFMHVVTETCFFDNKLHLTEKIFKPIVCKQPFLLLGCNNNLDYLKSYGFKTFNQWWSENYDVVYDPITRLNEVVKVINQICSLSLNELEDMLHDMTPILEHNYKWFYSKEFLDLVWSELKTNLGNSIARLELQK